MNIPPKYEDVVAKLETERARVTDYISQRAQAELKLEASMLREAALREELEESEEANSNLREVMRDIKNWREASQSSSALSSLLKQADEITHKPGPLQRRLTVAEQDNKSLRSQIGRVMVIFDMAADELVKDAARYRWLMSGSVLNGTLGIVGGGGWIDFEFKEEAGQKIDKAMQAEPTFAGSQSGLPDFWPCKSAEDLERYEAWAIKDDETSLLRIAIKGHQPELPNVSEIFPDSPGGYYNGCPSSAISDPMQCWSDAFPVFREQPAPVAITKTCCGSCPGGCVIGLNGVKP